MGRVPGGEDEGADGVFADINITPLTDIFLVLLIIFMVTSSVIVNQASGGAKAGLKVNLPTGGSADVRAAPTDMAIAILSDGRIVLSGDVVSEDELKKSLAATYQKNPGTLIVIQADEGVPHGKVVQVMEMAKSTGFADLAIGVRQQPK